MTWFTWNGRSIHVAELDANLRTQISEHHSTRLSQATSLDSGEQILSMLIEHVRDFHFDAHTNVGETHLSRVGAKVDKLFDAP